MREAGCQIFPVLLITQASREADRQLMELREIAKQGNPEAEKRLRKQIHRLNGLLEDAQMQIEHQVRYKEILVALR